MLAETLAKHLTYISSFLVKPRRVSSLIAIL